jgi:uncharacterized membrane protein (DUF373 family)
MVEKIERVVFKILTYILLVYIAAEVIELAYGFIQAALANDDPVRLIFSRSRMQEVLQVFFTILIGVELIDTFEHHMHHKAVKAINILLIGLMAIGRKLIAFDASHADAMHSFGLAALVIALALGYYFIKKVSPEASGTSDADANNAHH